MKFNILVYAAVFLGSSCIGFSQTKPVVKSNTPSVKPNVSSRPQVQSKKVSPHKITPVQSFKIIQSDLIPKPEGSVVHDLSLNTLPNGSVLYTSKNQNSIGLSTVLSPNLKNMKKPVVFTENIGQEQQNYNFRDVASVTFGNGNTLVVYSNGKSVIDGKRVNNLITVLIDANNQIIRSPERLNFDFEPNSTLRHVSMVSMKDKTKAALVFSEEYYAGEQYAKFLEIDAFSMVFNQDGTVFKAPKLINASGDHALRVQHVSSNPQGGISLVYRSNDNKVTVANIDPVSGNEWRTKLVDDPIHRGSFHTLPLANGDVMVISAEGVTPNNKTFRNNRLVYSIVNKTGVSKKEIRITEEGCSVAGYLSLKDGTVFVAKLKTIDATSKKQELVGFTFDSAGKMVKEPTVLIESFEFSDNHFSMTQLHNGQIMIGFGTKDEPLSYVVVD